MAGLAVQQQVYLLGNKCTEFIKITKPQNFKYIKNKLLKIT